MCGDVLPVEFDPYEFDGQIYAQPHGYRETILTRSVIDGMQNEVAARFGDNEKFISAPNREALAFIIKEENKFPLVGAGKILEACASLQHIGERCFVNRTSIQQGRGTPNRRDPFHCQLPGMAILVSHNFGFHEALLLWNLRANEVIVSWLSFSQLLKEAESIRSWLDSDLGASFFTFGEDVAFATQQSDQNELDLAFESLIAGRERKYPSLKISSYHDLNVYDLERPHFQRKDVMIAQDGNYGSFLLDSPLQNHLGTFAITVKWPTLMLPCRASLGTLICDERVETSHRPWSREPAEILETPKCRITRDRHARLQMSESVPVRFTIPTIRQVVKNLFEGAGYRQLRESSHAQYQNAFIENCGSFLQACLILKNQFFRELLKLLADNKNRLLPGWILKDPQRRALNQVDILKTLKKPLPATMSDYLRNAQTLPEEASQLLKLALLERGFQLSCRSCSALLWYRAEDVGQNFKCHRCYQDQRLQTNPLWLYKLPEVIFQFFNNDADVALMALFQLFLRSTKKLQIRSRFRITYRRECKGRKELGFCVYC